ncbi:DUF4442 domain-containing protein [Eisenibacter elegans]|jgi:acyl-coenzyme A thioesterase PaaI-like protein|uniref:DUF4442 domain-containing protein n=1 Tax=Eisenibacter elegans TaxID=997 RepID=UPI0004030C69|nr:DUF4442 domain-containing protein [Eisenibacter elegans]
MITSEPLKHKLLRWFWNYIPNAYSRSGGRIRYIAADYREVRVSLSLGWRTRNYVGTIFGGSMFAATDPFYMLMLLNILGKDYVVWDKAASIRFRKPGKGRLEARFVLTEAQIEQIKSAVAQHQEFEVALPIQLTNKEGQVCAEISRTVYIADKVFYKQKQAARVRSV